MTGSSRGVVTVLGLVAAAMLAGVVHIASLLAMPAVATDDAYARVVRIVPPNRATVLPRAGSDSDPLPGRDPAVASAICRYDLSNGPVRVSAALGDTLYAALSLHSRTGVAFYGLNDRSASGSRLELVVMTRVQMAEVSARDPPDAAIRDVRVTAPEAQGFVNLDVLPRVGGYPAALAALGSMRCDVEPER